MSAVIARGIDDVALDAMITRLEVFEARERAISSAAAFEIERDRKTPWTSLSQPLVEVEEDTDTPEPKGSTVRKACNFNAHVRIICLVPYKGDPDAAYSRFYYLKEQVRSALYALPTINLGSDPGELVLGRPTWRRVSFEDHELEASIVCGAWEFDLTYPWTPEDSAVVTPMTELSVAVGDKWSALYEYGGTP